MHSINTPAREADSTRTPRRTLSKTESTETTHNRRGLSQPASTQSVQTQAAHILALQKLGGNRAVSQLLQRSLTVGPANDAHEREAERVSAAATTNHGAPQHKQSDQHAAPPSQSAPGRSGGAPLPAATRSLMESRFGAHFGHVRVHTGREASQVNRALDAEAFTHQNHIYMGEGSYRPQSTAGQQLLAHELTHVVQQTGTVQRKPNKASKPGITVQGKMPAGRVSPKRKKLYLDFVRMKRLDARYDRIFLKMMKLNKLADKLGRGDTYGHWWTEVGDLVGGAKGEWKAERSWGWYPKDGAGGIKGTFKGTEGQINSTNVGTANLNDDKHGKKVKDSEQFHPVMELDPDKDDYVATRKRVIKQMSTFAKGYRGLWQWKLGWGQNCHTFQQEMKKAVGMQYTKGAGWFLRPPGVEGIYDTITAKRQRKHDAKVEAAWQQNNAGVEYVLDKELVVKSGGVLDVDGGERTLPAGTVVRALNAQERGTHLNDFGDERHIDVMIDRQYYNVRYGALKAAGQMRENLLLGPEDTRTTENPGFTMINEQ